MNRISIYSLEANGGLPLVTAITLDAANPTHINHIELARMEFESEKSLGRQPAGMIVVYGDDQCSVYSAAQLRT